MYLYLSLTPSQEDIAPAQPFFIFIRQRPLLAYELQRGNYRVIDINTYTLDITDTSSGASTVSSSSSRGRLATAKKIRTIPSNQAFSNLVGVHDGKLARNGRILEMKHK